MKTPEQCVDIVKQAFVNVYGRPGSYGEIAYAVAVAQLETSCGEGWGNASHNWGAVTGVGNAGSFTHKDSRPDGKGGTTSYATSFRAYTDDVTGATDFLRVLYREIHNNVNRDNVRAAADEVRFRDASAVLRASGYYSGTANVNDASGHHDEQASIEARIDAHANAVANHLHGPKGRFRNVPASYFGEPPKARPEPASGYC